MDLGVFTINLALCAGTLSVLEYKPPAITVRVITNLCEKMLLTDLAQGHRTALINEMVSAGLDPHAAEAVAGAAISRAKKDLLLSPQSRVGLTNHLRNRHEYLSSRLEEDLRMKVGVLYKEAIRALSDVSDDEAQLLISGTSVKLDGLAVEESQSRSMESSIMRLRVPVLVSTVDRVEFSPEDRRTIKAAEKMLDTLNLKPPALLRLGNVRYLAGDLPGARSLYTRALERDPRLAEAAVMLADVLLNLEGNHMAAIECASQALTVNAGLPQAWTVLGTAYERAGIAAKAEHCFQRALAMDPRDALAWNNLGVLYKDRMDLAKAQKCFERTIEIAHNFPPAWNNLGSVYALSGVAPKAMECYRKAIDLDPGYAAAWNNLGAAWGDAGDHAKEIECYKKALEADPNASMIWNNLGAAYQVSGDTGQARECFQKAIAIDPKNEAASGNLKALGG